MGDIVLTEQPQPPSTVAIDRLDAWLLVTASDMPSRDWRALPYGDVIHARGRRRSASNAGGILVTDLPNARGTRVAHLTLTAGASAFARLSAARKAVRSEERRVGKECRL